VLGLAAGGGALFLPERMGLGVPPKSELLSNQVMTVAWYLVGGLTAAATAQWLSARRERELHAPGWYLSRCRTWRWRSRSKPQTLNKTPFAGRPVATATASTYFCSWAR
jgi:hypothetical protein